MTREKFVKAIYDAHFAGFKVACDCILISGQVEIYKALMESYNPEETLERFNQGLDQETFEKILKEE